MEFPARRSLGSMNAYKYERLQNDRSIRLLILHPGLETSHIHLSLKETSVDGNESYCAVSYSWADEAGDSSLSSVIFCDEAYIKVTSNCEAGLARLRSKSEEIVLWVDAICIHQSDMAERIQQVRLMGDVYRNSKGVHIWLGQASQDVDPETSRPLTDISADFIKRLGDNVREAISLGKAHADAFQYEELIEREILTPLQVGLRDIFSRRWWSRVWVIQEYALAPSAGFFVGNSAVLFYDIEFFLMYMAHLTSENKGQDFQLDLSDASTLFIARNGLSDPTTIKTAGSAFLRHLEMSRTSQASDNRDKVFGVSGLNQNSEGFNFLSDYEQSTAEVYVAIAKAIIDSTRSLDVLCSCYGYSETPNLPSWAPDWAMRTHSAIFYERFTATKESKVICRNVEDPQVLQIKGKVISQVGFVASSANNDTEDVVQHSVTNVPIWSRFCSLAVSGGMYPTREDPKEVLSRTLCCDDVNFSPQSYTDWKQNFEAWYTILESKNASSDDIVRSWLQDPDARFYYARMRYIIWKKSLSTTQDGYIALVPDGTQTNDKIAVLAGGRMPFVIRSSSNDHFKLIGPCYMHGIMHGEAFPADEAELEWITLC